MELLIAFETNVLKWPGVNQAFLFSFVLTTALALEHFRRKGVEVAVLETGMANVRRLLDHVAPRI